MRFVLVTTAFPAVLFLVATMPSAVLRAEDQAGGARQAAGNGESGILMLQDGGVLTGQITQTSDWYIVSHGSGQMQVARARVALACRSLEEAYEYRRQQVNGSKADAHLALADWCLRYNLLADAARELADSRNLDPDHPRLALLERRLANCNAQPAAKAGAAPVAKVQPQAVASTPPTSAIAGDLPEGVVERFTRKVQPVLVNSCTTSNCHQRGGSQSFQLDRALQRGEANRRTTMYNLAAALALVDREHPEQSPLLTIPRKTHGGMAGPVFGPRQEQVFKHLAEWVELVVPPAPTSESATPDQENDAAMPPENGRVNSLASPIRTAATPDIHATAAILSAAEPLGAASPQSHGQSAVKAVAAIEDETAPALKQAHRLQYGATLQSWQPRDPFDPEIFNRLQQTRGSAPAAAVQTTAEPTR